MLIIYTNQIDMLTTGSELPCMLALCRSAGQLLDAGTVQSSTKTPPPPNAKGPTDVPVVKTAMYHCSISM